MELRRVRRVPCSGGSMIKGAPTTSSGARGNRREPMRHPRARRTLAPWSCVAHGKLRTGPDQSGPRSRAPIVVSAKTMREGVSSHSPSSAPPSSRCPRASSCRQGEHHATERGSRQSRRSGCSPKFRAAYVAFRSIHADRPRVAVWRARGAGLHWLRFVGSQACILGHHLGTSRR
jgi:hypothetical protein